MPSHKWKRKKWMKVVSVPSKWRPSAKIEGLFGCSVHFVLNFLLNLQPRTLCFVLSRRMGSTMRRSYRSFAIGRSHLFAPLVHASVKAAWGGREALCSSGGVLCQPSSKPFSESPSAALFPFPSEHSPAPSHFDQNFNVCAPYSVPPNARAWKIEIQ